MLNNFFTKFIQRNHKNIYFYIIIFILILLNFRYTFITGAQHDYKTNVGMWLQVIDGAIPWSLYGVFHGPLFWVVGLLCKYHILLPKIMSFVIWNVIFFILIQKIKYKKTLVIFYFVYLNSPNFWIEIFKWGHLETFMCFFTLLSLILHEKQKYILSGFFLSTAICFKIIPIILIPFLSINKIKENNYIKTINLKFTFSLIFLTCLIYLLSILFWDISAITSLIKIGYVKSENLSFFRFLRGEYSPISPISIILVGKEIKDILSFISYPILILGYTVIFFKYFYGSINRSNAILLASLLLPVIYKSSYAQYYTLYFVLLLYYIKNLGNINLELLIEKHMVTFLPLIIVTFHNFFYSFAFHIYQNIGEDPIWGGGSFGYFKIDEWIGALALLFFVPALMHFYKNKFKIGDAG